MIATYMPGAKIVHCRRNPMDNILSMYRSNLAAGNNYTASLEDSAKVLIAQEQAMKLHKMSTLAKYLLIITMNSLIHPKAASANS